MQTVKLNLIPGSVMPVVNVSQYDVNRQFALSVYEGAASYSLSGKSVEIRGTKPDGNGFAYDAQDGVVSVSGNTVTISTTQQMTAVGGQTMAELRIKSGTTILGTINFILDVEHSALSDDTPISETEIPVIERQLEELVEEIQVYTEDAEAWAVGERDGEPVPSSDPTYHNNAKYYASNALSSASTATTKASEAATSATNAGNSATTASNAATTATTKAGEASTSATNAGNSAMAAAADSLEAEGFSVGEQHGTPVGPDSPYYHNNAAYYAQEAGQHASGGIIFKGSLAFADLPTVGMASGDEYNITDDFTTDSRFIEGAGLSVKAGTNIAWVAGNVNKWDILATGGGGGADALDDLTDVTITSAADGDLLQYNGTSQEWENNAEIPNAVAALEETGAVNLFNVTAASQVVAGIPFTVNADNTIAADGTATGNIRFIIGSIKLKPGTYYLSGGANSDFYLNLQNTAINNTGGAATPFTVETETTYNLMIVENGTKTASNLLFKPQIALAPGIPFQPYAMTNRELTTQLFKDITDQFNMNDSGTYPLGVCHFAMYFPLMKVVLCEIQAGNNSTAAFAEVQVGSVAPAYKPAATGFGCQCGNVNNSANAGDMLRVKTNGTITLQAYTTRNSFLASFIVMYKTA